MGLGGHVRVSPMADQISPVIEDGSRVLLQGDSITDCGRDRGDPNSLGNGYAMMAASWFSAAYPAKKVEFINRGISGNRVKDLQGRWQEDCLDLKPTWVSIMIGINDCWRRNSTPYACRSTGFSPRRAARGRRGTGPAMASTLPSLAML